MFQGNDIKLEYHSRRQFMERENISVQVIFKFVEFLFLSDNKIDNLINSFREVCIQDYSMTNNFRSNSQSKAATGTTQPIVPQ